MAQVLIDIKAKAKIYPYIAPVKAVIQQAVVEAVTETTTSTEVTLGDNTSEKLDKFIENFNKKTETSKQESGVANLDEFLNTPASSNDQWKLLLMPPLDKIEKITTGMQKAVQGIAKIVAILEKILNILEMFVNTFGSFAKLIESVLNIAQTKINSYLTDSLKLGVFANFIAPPAFFTWSSADPLAALKSQGGFNGFIGRLKTSIDNTSDLNRPTYGPNDIVGGLVIMADSEDVDEIWESLNTLKRLFSFLGKFKLQMTPPQSNDINAFCGYFEDPKDPGVIVPGVGFVPNLKYGVKLEWVASSLAPRTVISRSMTQGGVTTFESYLPQGLMDDPETGEPGILSVFRSLVRRIARKEKFTLPERQVQAYKDTGFNSGKPKSIRNLGGSKKSYIDFDFEMKKIGDIKYPVDSNGNVIPMIYYVLQASTTSGSIKSPYSKEIVVQLKVCDDSYKAVDVISQPGGRVEFLAAGVGKLGAWSSIQITQMVPWFEILIKEISKFIDKLKGMTSTASSAFTKFIAQIKEKIDLYINILLTISWLIESLSNFVIGPSITMLELSPAKGGMDLFVKRIQNAKPPEGKTGFSGSSGITVGLVITYGTDPISGVALKKAISLIVSLLKKK